MCGRPFPQHAETRRPETMAKTPNCGLLLWPKGTAAGAGGRRRAAKKILKNSKKIFFN
jgi:hypothetical protein